MSGFTDVHVTAALAAELERAGWSAGETRARDLAAAAARGTNLVVESPPSPWHGLPVLAGLLSQSSDRPRRILVLASDGSLDEWAEVIAPLAVAAGTPLISAAGPARAGRQLPSLDHWVLLTTPATALALVQRSALKCADLTAFVLLWPEQVGAESMVEALMTDIDKEAPRAILTTDRQSMAGLGDRYARRALQMQLPVPAAPPEGLTPIGAIGKVYLATVPRARRGAAVTGVLEVLDPTEPYLWSPAATDMATMAAGQNGIPLLTGDNRPSGERPLVIALEIPTPERLTGLTQSADIVLLVPADALAWAGRIIPAALPLRLPGSLEAAQDAGAFRRRQIAARLEAGVPADGLLTLAPLFERHDPATVAAAIYALWSNAPRQTPGSDSSAPSVPSTSSNPTGTARVWVSLGKKDGGTANDLVGCLTRECRVERSQIGRIELRESFSLIEVPAADAEKIADRLTGITIRGRRMMARLDKNAATEPRGRPGPSRGPRPPSRRPTSGG